jgi:hypothetical protein
VLGSSVTFYAALEPHAAVRHHALIFGVIGSTAGVGDREPQIVRAGRVCSMHRARGCRRRRTPLYALPGPAFSQPPLARVAEDRIVREPGIERSGFAGRERRLDLARLVQLDPLDRQVLRER